MMPLVVIESPLGTRPDGTRCLPEEFKRNQEYVLACMLDCFRRGEAPFASHAIYPLVLNDATPEERKLGMEAGFVWGFYADIAAVYTDRGITVCMVEGIERHKNNGTDVEYRTLGGDWSK